MASSTVITILTGGASLTTLRVKGLKTFGRIDTIIGELTIMTVVAIQTICTVHKIIAIQTTFTILAREDEITVSQS